ncbi:MAG: RidA family protein [Pseudorhodoplanes sp.]|nr:putative aminoacrylate peracid reductase RutC [Pseudorhodoplanes sp.]MBW7950074.1 RidA family protein [Pseudorhodoplanes sp.]
MSVETIQTQNLPKSDWPMSHAVQAGNWLFTSAMPPLDNASAIAGKTVGRIDVEAQAAQCLVNLDTALSAFKVDRSHVTKTKSYLADLRNKPRLEAVLQKSWGPAQPARSCIGSIMPLTDIGMQIEATASLTEKAVSVVPARPVAPVGPAAPGGASAGGFFFSNGHPSIDAHGKLVARGDIRGQVEQALDNLGECLKAAGMDYSDVIKVNCTVPSWYGFMRYNEIYIKYFREPFPARATIQGRLSNEATLLEFEVVAAKGKEKVTIESVVTGIGHLSVKKRSDTIYVPGLPGAMAPHSHAVRVDDVVYICGQIPYEENGLMIGWGDIRAQTIKTMENHVLTMEALGASMDDIVKTNVSITEDSMIPIFCEEYAKFFKGPYPAMTIAVAGLAQDSMVLEVEAVAVIGASKKRKCLVR